MRRKVRVSGQRFYWHYTDKTREFRISDKKSKTIVANIVKKLGLVFYLMVYFFSSHILQYLGIGPASTIKMVIGMPSS